MLEADHKIEFIDGFDVSVLGWIMLVIDCNRDAILHPAVPNQGCVFLPTSCFAD